MLLIDCIKLLIVIIGIIAIITSWMLLFSDLGFPDELWHDKKQKGYLTYVLRLHLFVQ